MIRSKLLLSKLW